MNKFNLVIATGGIQGKLFAKAFDIPYVDRTNLTSVLKRAAEGKCTGFVAEQKFGSLGYSLILPANTQVFVTCLWGVNKTPPLVAQLEGRIARVGQRDNVKVIFV